MSHLVTSIFTNTVRYTPPSNTSSPVTVSGAVCVVFLQFNNVAEADRNNKLLFAHSHQSKTLVMLYRTRPPLLQRITLWYKGGSSVCLSITNNNVSKITWEQLRFFTVFGIFVYCWSKLTGQGQKSFLSQSEAAETGSVSPCWSHRLLWSVVADVSNEAAGWGQTGKRSEQRDQEADSCQINVLHYEPLDKLSQQHLMKDVFLLFSSISRSNTKLILLF